jgi:hypothetical protein
VGDGGGVRPLVRAWVMGGVRSLVRTWVMGGGGGEGVGGGGTSRYILINDM